mmetsp:Transcript_20465/g.39982  ORF Transcript_20465/g.39982 Transcript_20465/m.39982 type:complete len:206 (+) Transcript_20465:71-688(+)
MLSPRMLMADLKEAAPATEPAAAAATAADTYSERTGCCSSFLATGLPMPAEALLLTACVGATAGAFTYLSLATLVTECATAGVDTKLNFGRCAAFPACLSLPAGALLIRAVASVTEPLASERPQLTRASLPASSSSPSSGKKCNCFFDITVLTCTKLNVFTGTSSDGSCTCGCSNRFCSTGKDSKSGGALQPGATPSGQLSSAVA